MKTRTAVAVKTSAALGTLALCATCVAVELPQRKAGQWEIATTSDNPRIAAHIEEVCLDAATDALLSRFALGATQSMCTGMDIKASGGGIYEVDTTCNMGSRRVTLHGEVIYVGSSAYRQTIHARYDPPLLGRSETTSVQEAKWTGACAADMKPGDIVSRPSPTLPTGMRINLNDVMRGDAR